MRSYRRHSRIAPIRLSLEDIQQLWKLILQAIPPESHRNNRIQVVSRLPNERISADSLDEFLAHEDLPDVISHMWMEATGWKSQDSGNDIDRNLDITFSPYSTELDIRGLDETWVVGTFNRILDFLNQRKAPYGWLISGAPVVYGAVSGLVVWLLGTALVRRSWVLLAVLLVAGIVVASVPALRPKLAVHSRLILRPRDHRFPKEAIGWIISGAALTVSVVKLIWDMSHSKP